MFSILEILIIDIVCYFLFSKCSFLNYFTLCLIRSIFIDINVHDILINIKAKFFRKQNNDFK